MNCSPQKFIPNQHDFLSRHKSRFCLLPVVGSWLLREAPCGRVGCACPGCGCGCDCFLSVPGPDESPSSYGWAWSRPAWVPCWTAPLHSQATQPVQKYNHKHTHLFRNKLTMLPKTTKIMGRKYSLKTDKCDPVDTFTICQINSEATVMQLCQEHTQGIFQ